MMEKIILIGGGGHAKVVIDAFCSIHTFKIVGIIDEKLPLGSIVEGVSVIGKDKDLQKFFGQGIRYAFITVGSVGPSERRRQLVHSLEEVGFIFPSLVHKTAYLAPSVKLGKGVFVAPATIIQAGTTVGDYAIVNTHVSIDHDCKIGDFVHIAPGCVLCGGVVVDNDSHLGTGTCVIENVKIGARSLIGAGSVVVKNIPSQSKAYGNPCRVKTNL